MRISILGGAREIGASCYLLRIDKKYILVDCGIRIRGMETEEEKSLPDINRIRKLDLILLTHAHMDHIGGLPTVYKKFNSVKTICIPATFHIMVTLFRDTFKLSEYQIIERSKGPVTILSFDDETIEEIAKNIFLCKFGHWFKPFLDSNIQICFIRAGHILGAASILIVGKEGKVMFSGDFCLVDQKTILGLQKIDFQPDVLVIESTYGDKAHGSRAKEEKRLANTINEIISQGGDVLIPAFAVGRAQELILILKSFRESGLIPPCPIYIDGLVREVSSIYTNLTGKTFFGSGQISKVHGKFRDMIVGGGKPCCIISSSGMLIGGPSVFYAKQVVGDEKSAILFSGYQDEESPGKRILDTKAGSHLFLQGEFYKVKCKIEQYNLSAHADAPQLRHLICYLNPKATVLVHG